MSTSDRGRMQKLHRQKLQKQPKLTWFIVPEGIINYVDVSVVALASSALSRVRQFDINVPKACFDGMLERAAMHPGYSPRAWDSRELRVRDMCLCVEAEGGGSAGWPRMRVTRCVLQDAALQAGSPLLVRRYHRSVLPLPEFPHDRPIDSACRIRRLRLRIHRAASLVFESLACSDTQQQQQQQQQRRVRVEIDLSACRESDAKDLQRTVENTVQVVLLGMRSKVATQSV